MKLFFFPSHKDMSWDEAKKKHLILDLPLISFSHPCMKLFCQTIFSKQLNFTYKIAHETVFQKKKTLPAKLSCAKQTLRFKAAVIVLEPTRE